MERCTCDEAPDLENREAWQWGGCGDNLKYSSKFVKEFLGRRSSKDLRARVDFHNNLVGVKASRVGVGCHGVVVVVVVVPPREVKLEGLLSTGWGGVRWVWGHLSGPGCQGHQEDLCDG